MLDYPKTIKASTFEFIINSDGMPCKKDFYKFLKEKGFVYKSSTSHHPTKLMSYHKFKIEATEPIQSFDENIEFCESLVKEFEEVQESKIVRNLILPSEVKLWSEIIVVDGSRKFLGMVNSLNPFQVINTITEQTETPNLSVVSLYL